MGSEMRDGKGFCTVTMTMTDEMQLGLCSEQSVNTVWYLSEAHIREFDLRWNHH